MAEQWRCPRCGYWNYYWQAYCENCGTPQGGIEMRKEVIYLGIRLPPALHAKMAEIAREQSRSMNGQIIMALVDWLKPETWEERKELLGL